MITAYLGLGSNLGDREAHLAAARERLAALPGATLAAGSPVYATEPWGDADQPGFRNQVVALELDDSWSARRLLAALQAIEAALGRVRDPGRRFGPRTIDLDILLFGGQRLNEPDLVVPHPRLRQRAFVLVPLADLAPDLPIPDGQGGGVAEALAKIPFKISGNSLWSGD
ncbi:MAG: 2-amino-4-hydroxy-6-hydroxymethyldihydropteridine diphosphokinase [Solidesulfovibrio sp. DCME]|uniref:2-amino-4-hydroxy-6- hydroxymethyldihydropteridine diphosphokinase n=1 Tax=Solidesulfovibrio sp. DCME TaxID=3447380 RepID=UPI003D0D5EFB